MNPNERVLIARSALQDAQPPYHKLVSWFTAECLYAGRHVDIRIPLKHAEKFARPCKRCFGGEG